MLPFITPVFLDFLELPCLDSFESNSYVYLLDLLGCPSCIYMYKNRQGIDFGLALT